MNSKEDFNYSYSASVQEEIEQIRKKYVEEKVSDEEIILKKIRKLDSSVTSKGTIVSIVVGVVCALIMGLGMSMCMVWTETLFIPGIIVGVIGMAGVIAAYPLYAYVTKKEKEKVAPEIIRLTDKLK